MKKKLIIISFLGVAALANAQINTDIYDVGEGTLNPLYTALPSLSIAPDARAGGMGDVGAATTPDVFSQHWNPSKYAFMESKVGFAFSYTPWLRTLVDDINLGYVCGYWKLGDLQAFSASFRYFSMGNVTLRENDSDPGTIANPNEFSFDLAYSRLLGEHFSMAVAFRYIRGDLNVPATSAESEETFPANAFAADVAAYYQTPITLSTGDAKLAFGLNLSNIGTKVSYDEGLTNNFLPTNLRLGFSFLFPIYDYNTLSINFDANKLLVPAAPRQSDYTYIDGDGYEQYDTEAYNQAKEDFNNTGSIAGIFKSFTDAPGGFKEELREIYFSTGLEYSYNRRFFVRAGYYYENKYKGNRQYATFGAGFSLNVFSLDAAYVLATAQSSPLDQTMRFTLSFDMDGIKDLIGRRRR